jgi:hypothetical protein
MQYWQSAEEFGWCTHNVGICYHTTVSMMCTEYWCVVGAY